MNNYQINEILLHDRFTKKIYKGCFPIDKLPLKITYPCCFIVNNQKSNENGEHWVSIFYESNKTAVFFDSFGLSPKYYNLENYITSTSKSFSYNKIQLQSIFSSYCGYYCILFLLFKARNKSLNFIQKKFRDPISNDTLIKKFIKKYRIQTRNN